MELDPTGLDLRQVEHVVDQVEQMVGAAMDVLDPLDRDRDRVADRRLVAHQVAEPEDRAERGPQLVAHAGEEVALRLARGADGVHGGGEACGKVLELQRDSPAFGEDRRLDAQRGQRSRDRGLRTAIDSVPNSTSVTGRHPATRFRREVDRHDGHVRGVGARGEGRQGRAEAPPRAGQRARWSRPAPRRSRRSAPTSRRWRPGARTRAVTTWSAVVGLHDDRGGSAEGLGELARSHARSRARVAPARSTSDRP